MKRRSFLKLVSVLGGAAAVSPLLRGEAKMLPHTDMQSRENAQQQPARVVLVKTRDRAAGVQKALDLLGVNPVSGKTVFLKPNYNSADPTPGSTHLDVLRTLAKALYGMGATRITLGDRSGMGNTRQVLENRGVFALAQALNFDTLVLDELPADEWQPIKNPNTHWSRGFAMPKALFSAGSVVQTCCLKTHRYGGHFTLSLKNSVGLAARTIPGQSHNYMTELHGSAYQRVMIAELNAAYRPDLIVMDGVEAFVDGGPDQGTKVWSEAILASTDRVAIDAVGVAILRHFGTTPNVSKGKIFNLEQIHRAVELGVGVTTPDQIELVTDDADSAAYANTLRTLLRAG